MRGSFAVVVVGLAGSALAGCASGGGDHPSLASLGTPAPVEAAPVPGAAPAPEAVVSRGPLLDGPIGLRLPEGDRDVAFKAETDALASGNRRTWRGQKGTYGFVVPDASASASAPPSSTGGAPGECRSFTHTIYFAGRPQVGHGTGCREPDGSWRVTG